MQSSEASDLIQQIREISKAAEQKEKEDQSKTKNVLSELEHHLENAISCLDTTEELLNKGGESCGEPLTQTLDEYVKTLREMGNVGTEIDATQMLPLLAIEYADSGQDPDLTMLKFYIWTQTRIGMTRKRIFDEYVLEKYLKQGYDALFASENNDETNGTNSTQDNDIAM